MFALQVGYWNIHSGRGCDSCQCDAVGSVNLSCNAKTGQCHCRLGVGGLKCDQCIPGYFGFSSSGCKGKILEITIIKYYIKCSLVTGILRADIFTS